MCIKVIVFCVAPIVPESFMIAYQVSMSWFNCSKMSEGFGGRSYKGSNVYFFPVEQQKSPKV